LRPRARGHGVQNSPAVPMGGRLVPDRLRLRLRDRLSSAMNHRHVRFKSMSPASPMLPLKARDAACRKALPVTS
jgi:hypothetical protein